MSIERRPLEKLDRIINMNYLTRVEGQAALDIWISGTSEVRDLKLRVFEPSRFFESFVIGRRYDELMELAARICGICPVSHEITALRAVENAMGLEVSEATRKLRKLMALSAFVSSHALSIYFLTLPDYLGYSDLAEASKEHGELLKSALKLKKLGNDLTELIGGRSVHPVTAVIGRFTNTISKGEANIMIKRCEEAKADAFETIELFKELEIPKFNRKCEHIALNQPNEYAINEGYVKSTESLYIPQEEYRNRVEESQIPYSHSKPSTVKGRSSYLVGPLARVNINFEHLSEDARNAANSVGFKIPSFNPFYSPIARAVEIVHSLDECIELLETMPYKEDEKRIRVKTGKGCAITEAPRGMNYHSYLLDDRGIVVKADIAPPTCQNHGNIEMDLRELLPLLLDLPDEEIAKKCGMLIRSYDPCISCSVHTVNIHRTR
ncbi:Ni/Fe hydrogenase subunit alpha [Candidatus Bathyarchaeota archaeon]|nr:Ni/Fe hydrogenase subunit alpha [Candidatus Bathyarchaeota archaeon]MBS7630286.1 Ni/Fe hydrogenase subunit alpha [Candidatus Bathyarchaeota archaeon]